MILYEKVGFIVSDFVANMKSASKHKGKYCCKLFSLNVYQYKVMEEIYHACIRFLVVMNYLGSIRVQ